MLIAIVGRVGVGKSTIAEYLTPQSPIKLVMYDNPWAYILSVLFGWDYRQLRSEITSYDIKKIKSALSNDNQRDPIWKLSKVESFGWLLTALKKFPKSIINAIHLRGYFYAPDNDHPTISFSGAMKKIAVAISGLSYEAMNSSTKECHRQREKQLVDHYLPGINANQLIKVLSENFKSLDPDLWLKIFEKEYLKLERPKIVISDLRDENEYRKVKKLGGRVLVVARSKSELIADDRDGQFLNFVDCENDPLILNNGTKEQLYQAVDHILSIHHNLPSAS